MGLNPRSSRLESGDAAEDSAIQRLSAEARRRVFEEERARLDAEEAAIRGLSPQARRRIYEEEKARVERKAAPDSKDAPPGPVAFEDLELDDRAVEMPAFDASKWRPREDPWNGPSRECDLESAGPIRFRPGAVYRIVCDDDRRPEGEPTPVAEEAPAPPSDDSRPERASSAENEPSPPAPPGVDDGAASPPTSAASPDSRKPKQVHMLTGLRDEQIELLREIGTRRQLLTGQPIYNAGDPVKSFYIVLSGKVEIFTERDGREVELGRRGARESFGEVELVCHASRRRSSARAARPSTIFEIPGNPIEMFRWLADRKTAMKLLRNLICIFAERLRRDGLASRDEADDLPVFLECPDRTGADLQGVRQGVSRGLIDLMAESGELTVRSLPPGRFLFRQGQGSDEFHLIHRGAVEVLREGADGRSHRIARLPAPTIVGEISFFARQHRADSVRSIEPIVLSQFSGDGFRRLRRENPEQALELMLAAAQLATGLVAAREASPV